MKRAGLKALVVAVAAALAGWLGPAQLAVGYGGYGPGDAGYDVSWPQCGEPMPGVHRVGVVGVTGGRPFTANPCLRTEYGWALDQPGQPRRAPVPALYMNLAYSEATSAARNCPFGERGCDAYNGGYASATDALSQARSAGAFSDVWWLDVETENYWSDRQDLNADVIQGAIDRLRHEGIQVGIYSTPRQWQLLTGDGYAPGLPVWVAGPNSRAEAGSYCSPARGFGGGKVWMVQFPLGAFDGDIAC